MFVFDEEQCFPLTAGFNSYIPTTNLAEIWRGMLGVDSCTRRTLLRCPEQPRGVHRGYMFFLAELLQPLLMLLLSCLTIKRATFGENAGRQL